MTTNDTIEDQIKALRNMRDEWGKQKLRELPSRFCPKCKKKLLDEYYEDRISQWLICVNCES